MIVYTDGSSRPGQKQRRGPGGAGVVLRTGRGVLTYSVPLGDVGSGVAEAYALLLGLSLALRNLLDENERIKIKVDDLSLAEAICKETIKTTNRTYKALLESIKQLMGQRRISVSWVPSEKNEADIWAKRASLSSITYG